VDRYPPASALFLSYGGPVSEQAGTVTRLVLLNVPPVKVPPTVRVEAPLAGVAKFTITVAELPGLIVPMDCGSGVPLVVPSLAVVSITLLAGNVPMFVTVMVACTFPGLVHARVEEVTSLIPPHGEGPAVKV
jgi:hypothetical protein